MYTTVKLAEPIDRDAATIECECGSRAVRVPCILNECIEYGCGRDNPGQECCARAFQCLSCGKRFVGTAEAPDANGPFYD
jgi:hypothetical protein